MCLWQRMRVQVLFTPSLLSETYLSLYASLLCFISTLAYAIIYLGNLKLRRSRLFCACRGLCPSRLPTILDMSMPDSSGTSWIRRRVHNTEHWMRVGRFSGSFLASWTRHPGPLTALIRLCLAARCPWIYLVASIADMSWIGQMVPSQEFRCPVHGTFSCRIPWYRSRSRHHIRPWSWFSYRMQKSCSEMAAHSLPEAMVWTCRQSWYRSHRAQNSWPLTWDSSRGC